MLLKTSIFQEQFHNKAERVCIKTRSPSASLPSITVKWPIENQKFKRRTKVCNIWQHLVTDTGLLFKSLRLNWILVLWGLSQFFSVNVQWTLSFVTPSFSRDTSFQATQNLVAEKFLRNLWIFYFYQCSTEGRPLFREGHFSLDPKPGFDLQPGDTLAVKKWLITKIVDKFKCLLVTMVTAFKTWTIPFLMMYCTYGNSTHSVNIAGR